MSKKYHNLETGNFFQDWSDPTLLRRGNDWSGVPSIMAYRGAALTGAPGSNARTVSGFSEDTYVAVDRLSPNDYGTSGIAEFAIEDPTIALSGSSAARAPSLVLYMDATGREDVTLSFTARDLESGPDNAKQQIVVQYRLGDGGAWTNAPGGYIADATIGGATMETRLTVTLPGEVDGRADLQVRIMTVDAYGLDEWVGIDDISVTSQRDPGYVPPAIAIYTIQGEGHESAFDGQLVRTNGVVTAIGQGGFYIQAVSGDGKVATSDAIFVRGTAGSRIAVGDRVIAQGVVHENGDGTGLTVTELSAEKISILSRGNALPTAVVIGDGGRMPPTEIIEDDALGSFDPDHDGLDFWESLEGMRVTIDRPQAVSNTDSYGQTWLVASGGDGATGINANGGISIGSGDFNPEVIQLDDKLSGQPLLSIGDELIDLTGVIGYSANHYEFLATETATIVTDVTQVRETTALAGDANHMTVATYNVANLDPSDARFGQLADDIVDNLRAPDVIALQKVQDPDGTSAGSELSAAETAARLIDAIFAASGIRYTYVEIAPDAANTTAGQYDGNIRVGYLYRADRVELVSLTQIDDPIFDGTRTPLVATWEFNGHEVTTVNVHFTSRFGSDPLWGGEQQPYAAGTIMRTNQIAAVQRYVENLLARDPDAHVMIAGDWNGYLFERAQTQLTDEGQFHNLALGLDAAERYSSIVDGSGQLTDNIVVSGNLLDRTDFDIVHINAEFAGSPRGSDHDPLVASIFLEHAPDNLAIVGGSVRENLSAGAYVGQITVDDTPGDMLTYRLLDDGRGSFRIDAQTGVVTTARWLNYEGTPSITIVAQVTDSLGLSVTRELTVNVVDINEAPVAANDRVDVAEDAQSANLWSYLLANDSDPDAGAVLTISAVDLTGTYGSIVFNPVTATLRYSADHDAFDALAPGQSVTDRFTYTVQDQFGVARTATVEVIVTGTADGVTLYGGNGVDLLLGTSGDDRLFGGNGADTLIGGAGHDWLQGDNAADLLTGGSGHDSFAFGHNTGKDTISDFNKGQDRIVLMDGMEVKWSTRADVNGDGKLDLRIFLTDGGNIQLLGVDALDGIVFAQADAPELPGGLFFHGQGVVQLPFDLGNQAALFL